MLARMTTADPMEDVEAALAAMPREAREELVRQWWKAATAPPPPQPALSLFPPPQFPYGPRHPDAGAVRWNCPLGCGWWHEENPGRELPGPLRLPAGLTSEDVSEAVSRQAQERSEALRQRVEDAITEHYGTAHPGLEPGDVRPGS